MRVLTTLIILFAALSIHAQSATDPDSRLLEVYEADYLARMETNHPVMLARLNYYLDHAWFITEYPTQKGTPNFPEVTIEDLDQINILQLEKTQALVRDYDQRKMYTIAGTNKVLVYFSGKEFTENFNAFIRG